MEMRKEGLQVSKPHYISRYDQASNKHRYPTQKQCSATYRPQLKRVKPHRKLSQQKNQLMLLQEVAKIKRELLALLQNTQTQLQLDSLMKRVSVSRQKQSHKRILAQVRDQLEAIRRQTYLMYKHNCTNPKHSLCNHCQSSHQAFKTRLIQFLQNPSPQPTPTPSHDHPPETRKPRNTATEPKTADPNLQNNGLLNTWDYSAFDSHNSHQKARKSERFSGFRINRKTDNSRATRKRIMDSAPDQQNQGNNNENVARDRQRKNTKKNSMFRSFQNNTQSSKVLNQRKQPKNSDSDSEKSSSDEEIQNFNPKRLYRKSIKLDSDEKQLDSPHAPRKSKFYDLSNEQKNSKSSEIRSSGYRNSKTFEKKPEESEDYKMGKDKHKQRIAIYQRTKQVKKSQLMMDLSEMQSSKEIEQEKVHRERDQIEQLMRVRHKPNDSKLSKLSRYQRQRIIYDYLKKELVKLGCVEESIVQELDDCSKDSEASIDSSEPNKCYSIKDRKQSLLSKLSIFNQSFNFEDLKNKIENAIQQQAFGDKLLDTQSMSRTRREQKIVEKFLAEVLKINDLKRLLRKKFSKELDWSPKMREMHQFYTYLEFNLENFRLSLTKNTQSSWKQLALEGKEQQLTLEQLYITEDLGHYQGLENAEITEFDHHKEIQCSMRYYGIEVKRLRQLQDFLYTAPELPQQPPDRIAQKSLKQIKEYTTACTVQNQAG